MLLLLLSSTLIIYTKNPLHATLALILVFMNSAILLLKINADFLALIYVVVYVGAICVMFLFVIMLLNLRSTEIANKPIYKKNILPYFATISALTLILTYGNTAKINIVPQPLLHDLLGGPNTETNFMIPFIFGNQPTFIILTLLLYLAILAPIYIAKKS